MRQLDRIVPVVTSQQGTPGQRRLVQASLRRCNLAIQSLQIPLEILVHHPYARGVGTFSAPGLQCFPTALPRPRQPAGCFFEIDSSGRHRSHEGVSGRCAEHVRVCYGCRSRHWCRFGSIGVSNAAIDIGHLVDRLSTRASRDAKNCRRTDSPQGIERTVMTGFHEIA